MKNIAYRIGVEIETCLEEWNTCENCSNCEICHDCPNCMDCYDYHYFCSICDLDIIIEELEYLGISINENISICDKCRELEIWKNVSCERCDRCNGCDYYMNLDYCPLDYNERANNSEFNIKLDDVYNDGSCGLEFVTTPYNSLKKLWKDLKSFVDAIGTEYMSPEDCCGGHTNISWVQENITWEDKKFIIIENSIFFQDLLSYLFCSKSTYHRYEYKYPTLNYIDSSDKYRAVHYKSYAVEFRLFDSPYEPDNHILASAVALAITLIPYKIHYTEEDISYTIEIYRILNKYIEDFDESNERYLREKFKVLIKHIKPYLKELSNELNVNLIKALEWRLKFPKWQEDKHGKTINLSNFELKEKATIAISNTKQLALTAFC